MPDRIMPAATLLFREGGDVLGEGPCWDPGSQRLYWSDIMDNELHRVAADGSDHVTVRVGEKVHAIAATSDPGTFLCTAHKHGLAWLNAATGGLLPIANPEPDRGRNLLNDGRCAPDGTFWFASMNKSPDVKSGALYSLDAECRVVRHHDGLGVSNGIAFSPDGGHLYIADTYVGIWRFRIDRGGAADPRLIFDARSGAGKPDGLTIDRSGCLWVAMALGGEVIRLDPDGVVLDRLPVPSSFVTSCTFGGPQLDTLYITTARAGRPEAELAAQPSAGGLFAAATGLGGLPETPFSGRP